MALPYDDNGRVIPGDSSSTLYNSTVALTPKFAKIDHATNGNNTIVSAVTGKKIRVVAYHFVSAGTVNAKWASDTAAPTDLSGSMALVANTVVSAPYCPVGHFETVAAKALNLILDAGVSVDGVLTYVEV